MDDSPSVWILDLMEHKFLNYKYELVILSYKDYVDLWNTQKELIFHFSTLIIFIAI